MKLKRPEFTEPPEHPEDRAIRIVSEKYAKSPEVAGVANDLCVSEELYALVTTWRDDEAHAALDRMREKFWMDPRVIKATTP